MKSKYSVEKRGSYLYISILGEYIFQDFNSYVEIILNECESRKIYLVLMDLFNVKLNVPIMEKIILGEETAKKFKDKIKMAIIGDERYIDKVYEIVTVKLGGNVHVTWDEAKAIRWLLSENVNRE